MLIIGKKNMSASSPRQADAIAKQVACNEQSLAADLGGVHIVIMVFDDFEPPLVGSSAFHCLWLEIISQK